MIDAAKNVGTPKPYIGNRAVQWNRIDVSGLSFVRMSSSEFARYRLRVGDLLVCEGGEVARAAIWDAPIAECYYQKALHRLRPRCDYDPRLMQALLQFWATRGDLADEVTRTSIAHLPREKLVALPLPVPPPREQRAITTALGDVDGLLGALDKLIAKKRDLKQATMQQLLTGRTRLPGFTDEWRPRRLGDHLAFLKHGSHSRAELIPAGPVKYLHYGDIHGSTGLTLAPSATAMPCLPASKAVGLDRLADGDVVFADASEDLDGVGKSVELQHVGETEVVSGMHTIVVRFDKQFLADGFKAYLQFIPAFRDHLRRLAAGTKVYATNKAYIASAEVRLPTTDEQTAIATVLSDMDAEIAALEVRRAKTADLKQAMMQELLTGRIRLI